MEKKKLEEEASTYVIRERQACEEAFGRFVLYFVTNMELVMSIFDEKKLFFTIRIQCNQKPFWLALFDAFSNFHANT